MPLNIISYKKAIWKGIEGHLKGIVQKLEDSRYIMKSEIKKIYFVPHKYICNILVCIKLNRR